MANGAALLLRSGGHLHLNRPLDSYRMRLINMACDPNYIFSIDDHWMTVIEADGVNHQPVQVTSMQIYAGQRYSFIVSPVYALTECVLIEGTAYGDATHQQLLDSCSP